MCVHVNRSRCGSVRRSVYQRCTLNLSFDLTSCSNYGQTSPAALTHVDVNRQLGEMLATVVKLCRKTPGFSKKHNPLGFLGFYWVLGFIGFLIFFYLNQPLRSLLFNLASQYQYFRLSENLQIHHLLVVRSCKHKEI